MKEIMDALETYVDLRVKMASLLPRAEAGISEYVTAYATASTRSMVARARLAAAISEGVTS